MRFLFFGCLTAYVLLILPRVTQHELLLNVFDVMCMVVMGPRVLSNELVCDFVVRHGS